MVTTDGSRQGGDAFCTRCGASLRPGARFCPECGAAVGVEPPPAPPAPPSGPPPGPPGPPGPPATPEPPATRRSRVPVIVGVAVAVAVVVIVAVLVLGGGDDDATTPATRGPVTAPRAVTTLPAPTPTSAERRYVGLERDQGTFPAAVTEIGGTYLEPGYGVAWVQGPEGTMLWLERVAASSPDLGVTRWKVVDVVATAQIAPESPDTTVVLGGTRCEVNGSTSSDVVGVFRSTGEEWLDAPQAVWRIDRSAGRLVPVTGSVRCTNEGYGV